MNRSSDPRPINERRIADNQPAELKALGITLEEPIERPTKGSVSPTALEVLAKYPGQWAKIRTWKGQSGAYAAQKRLKEQLKDGNAGNFEFTCRRTEYTIDGKGGGGSILYARYVGASGGQG